jgi:hypothetical protein
MVAYEVVVRERRQAAAAREGERDLARGKRRGNGKKILF